MCVCFVRYNSRWTRMWHVSYPIWSCLYLLVWRFSYIYGKQFINADILMCFYINWQIRKSLWWLKNYHRSMYVNKSMVDNKKEEEIFGLFWIIVPMGPWRNTGSCEINCHKIYIYTSCSCITLPQNLQTVLNVPWPWQNYCCV